MKHIIKTLAIVLFSTIAFTSCKKDAAGIVPKNDLVISTPDNLPQLDEPVLPIKRKPVIVNVE